MPCLTKKSRFLWYSGSVDENVYRSNIEFFRDNLAAQQFPQSIHMECFSAATLKVESLSSRCSRRSHKYMSSTGFVAILALFLSAVQGRSTPIPPDQACDMPQRHKGTYQREHTDKKDQLSVLRFHFPSCVKKAQLSYPCYFLLVENIPDASCRTSSLPKKELFKLLCGHCSPFLISRLYALGCAKSISRSS